MQESDQSRLQVALTDELQQLLLTISHAAALDMSGEQIEVLSHHALRIIDSYTSAHNQIALEFEPVNVSSALYEVAHSLVPMSRQLGCKINIDVRGVQKPVMTHPRTLREVLFLLGSSLMQANSDLDNHEVVLGTHSSRDRVVAGAFSAGKQISQADIRQARDLHGLAHRPSPLLGNSGASIVLAEKLSQRISTSLRSLRHNAVNGVGVSLDFSKQLQLVQ